MRKKFRAMVSLFLTFCMAVSMLSSPGLAAETGQSSLLVIEGFKNFDCYGTEPYQQLDDYDPEIASLPESVQAIWSNGESSELSVSW